MIESTFKPRRRLGKTALLGAGAAFLLWAVVAALGPPMRPSRGARTDNLLSQKLSIIYTADTNGFLQSCGCAAAQVGGLAKRATLVHRLKTAGVPCLLVDGGNLGADLRRSEAVMASLQFMRYDAVGLAALEERLGSDFLDAASRHELPLIACPPPEGAGKRTSPWRMHPDAGFGVAVVGISKGAWAKQVAGLQDTLARLRGTRLIVALSSVAFDQEIQLLDTRGIGEAVHLLIGMRGSKERRPVERNGVTLVPVPGKGAVGVVEVTWEENGRPSFDQHFEAVREDLAEDRDIQQLVGAYFADETRELLEASLRPEVDWRKTGYQSADRCADCHGDEVLLWQHSRHALATYTLKAKNRLVPECLSCHSELFRRTGKFNPQVEAAWLGVDCAACHGDGVVHSAVRTKESVRRKVDEQTCRGCHTAENDPKFDYVTYREKIRHW